MKKTVRNFIFGVGLVCMAVAFNSCSKKKAEIKYEYTGKPEYAEFANQVKGVLKVGIECAYAPFNWTQPTKEIPGHPELTAEPIFGSADYTYGYDVIFSKMIADEMGLKLEIHKNDWASIWMGLKAGDYDLVESGSIYSAERDTFLDYIDPYYNRFNVIVVKKGSPYEKYTRLEQFKGLKFTTQINTNWPAYIAQVPDPVVLPFPDTCTEVIMKVAMGDVDCGVMDWPTAYSGCLSNPNVVICQLEKGYDFVTPEGASDVCTPSVIEGNTVAVDALKKAMNAIGWNQESMDKYMKLAIETQPLSN